MRDKKHLVHHSNKLAEQAREKALFRAQRKPVEAGAHGTLSYKRLIPGFEAPVLLAYSARNRSASCRIPITLSKKGAR